MVGMVGKSVTITCTLGQLWSAYGKGASGRFPCPISLPGRGTATHIYRGFGSIRLERITGQVKAGKGFQGEVIADCLISKAGKEKVALYD